MNTFKITLFVVSWVVVYCGKIPTKSGTYTPQFAPFFGKTLNGNYFLAFQYCNSIGLQMVTPNTPEKFDALIRFMKENNLSSVWVSANDLAIQDSFIWMVNSNPIEKGPWHDGQPDNYNNREYCIEMRNIKSVYKFNDDNCNYKFPVVCEPKP